MHGSGGLGFTLRLDSPLEHECGCDGIDLFLNAICPIYARRETVRQTDEDGRSGLRFQIRARLVTQDGTICTERNCIRFNGSGPVLLLVAIRSDFSAWNREPDGVFPADRCREDLDRAAALSASELLEAHLSEYQALYRRSCLELPATEEDLLPTDERIARYAQSESPALAALLYQFGRYLLISSSRRGTQPANLQGIWNPHVLPPWGSNYTTNINTEMNYWPAEAASLAECVEPLYRFVRECAVNGMKTAEKLYGCRGWCMHHNSDLWRKTTPAACIAQCSAFPFAGFWLLRQFYEHYLYSGDKIFLKKCYDLYQGAARFILDFLQKEEDGTCTISPSTSPENGFLEPSEKHFCCVSAGSAVDLTIARELFETFREIAAELQISEPMIEEIEEVLPRLRLPGIGRHGQLLEYDDEFEEALPDHRHLSHLYGVCPGAVFTPEQHKELYEAGRVSLAHRSDFSTGWAMAWRTILWTRYLDGEHAMRCMSAFPGPVILTVNTRCGACRRFCIL